MLKRYEVRERNGVRSWWSCVGRVPTAASRTPPLPRASGLQAISSPWKQQHRCGGKVDEHEAHEKRGPKSADSGDLRLAFWGGGNVKPELLGFDGRMWRLKQRALSISRRPPKTHAFGGVRVHRCNREGWGRGKGVSLLYHAFILGQSMTGEIMTQEGVLLELPLEQEVERIRLAWRKWERKTE